jgi:hypothetical protein
MAKGDNRAVIGASGRPEVGMVLESGTKTIAKILGNRDAPSGSKSGTQGQKFDVEGMQNVAHVKMKD